MTQQVPVSIIFVDNQLHGILRTLDQLRLERYMIHAFNHEKEAKEFLSLNRVEIVFLNLDLCPQDGISFARELKVRQEHSPFVVIYSHRHDDFVIELALDHGADAFIGFHEKPSLLSLFVRNLVRRQFAVSSPSQARTGITVDRDSFLIYRNGKAVQLRKKQFCVFELLFNCAGSFVSREEIAGQIWQNVKVAQSRVIDVHIYNIRRIFGKAVIQSARHKGYRFNAKFLQGTVHRAALSPKKS